MGARLDPVLLPLLRSQTAGATATELASYLGEKPLVVRDRLKELAKSGRVVSFRNPHDGHQMLWAFSPQRTLTPAPVLHRSKKTGARTR